MTTYSMTCDCGDTMTVEAADRDAAVKQFQEMMTQDAVDQHFAQKHAGAAKPSLDQVHSMIGLQLTPA